MMLSSAQAFVNGIDGTVSEAGDGAHVGPRVASASDRGLFGQYVAVYQSNEFLFAELKSVGLKLDRARAYIASPGANPVLGAAHLDRLKARRSAVLTLLRANRLQARALLSRNGDGQAMGVA